MVACHAFTPGKPRRVARGCKRETALQGMIATGLDQSCWIVLSNDLQVMRAANRMLLDCWRSVKEMEELISTCAHTELLSADWLYRHPLPGCIWSYWSPRRVRLRSRRPALARRSSRKTSATVTSRTWHSHQRALGKKGVLEAAARHYNSA